MALAKEKFWIFGVRPHQDDVHLYSKKRDFPRYRSRITPAEAAFILDTPNVMMINCEGEPAPFSEDAYGYAESFCRMKHVLWGATGSGGFRIGNEEAFICELAKTYPNISGAFMDDFSSRFRKLPEEERKDAQIRLLRDIRAGLDKACRPMELYVTWYWHDEPDAEVMSYIDGITLWTWHSEELPLLEERFNAIEGKFPNHKKLLGIYMYDFPERHAVSLDLMEYQCNTALRLMKEGRIDGMIFETNSVRGVGLPSELWLRDWVDRVKDTEVPDERTPEKPHKERITV